MRKRYSEQELEFIKKQASLGTSCEDIGKAIGVSAASIHHVISRRNIPFCRKPFNSLPGEIWKDCLNISDIQVSNMGRVARKSTNSLISGYKATCGYQYIDISGYGVYLAHRLVAMVFIPNPENKPEVNHKDGVKTNNCVVNLEWVTPEENIRHSIEIGLRTFRSGQDHHRTALTTEQIIQCEKLYSSGLTYEEVGKRFNVDRHTVSRHVKKYRRDAERSETIP